MGFHFLEGYEVIAATGFGLGLTVFGLVASRVPFQMLLVVASCEKLAQFLGGDPVAVVVDLQEAKLAQEAEGKIAPQAFSVGAKHSITQQKINQFVIAGLVLMLWVGQALRDNIHEPVRRLPAKFAVGTELGQAEINEDLTSVGDFLVVLGRECVNAQFVAVQLEDLLEDGQHQVSVVVDHQRYSHGGLSDFDDAPQPDFFSRLDSLLRLTGWTS